MSLLNINNILKSTRDIKATMYSDVIEVYRSEKTIVNGITRVTDLGKVFEGNCKISFGDRDDRTVENDFYVTGYLPINIITFPESDIIKGDKIIARRYEGNEVISEYQGIANKPQIYMSQMEFMFVDKGKA